jgi:hypothetical protein
MTQSDDWRRGATAEQMRSVVRAIDPSVAHIARIQDYWLGGKGHFEADQIAGDEAVAQLPDMVASVRNTRAFLGRTVRFLAAEQGIRQFLDVGTGIPTASPAGSYLVISHPAADIQAAAMAGMATRLNSLMAQQVKPRTKAEVTAFFDGLDLVDPGVIRCPEWRPDRPQDAAGKSTMWGGVAEKPASAPG